MDVIFQHIVRKSHEDFDLSDPFDQEAPDEVKIHMNVAPDGDFWLSASREGYLHLARVFAEIGTRNLEDGYHFHMDSSFQASAGPPEFTFQLIHDNSKTPNSGLQQ